MDLRSFLILYKKEQNIRKILVFTNLKSYPKGRLFLKKSEYDPSYIIIGQVCDCLLLISLKMVKRSKKLEILFFGIRL